MKLVFEGKGGYAFERETAKDKLVVGRAYTVEKIEVGGCRTEVSLVNISGSFNSVLFECNDLLESIISGKQESDGTFELVKNYFIFNLQPKGDV